MQHTSSEESSSPIKCCKTFIMILKCYLPSRSRFRGSLKWGIGNFLQNCQNFRWKMEKWKVDSFCINPHQSTVIYQDKFTSTLFKVLQTQKHASMIQIWGELGNKRGEIQLIFSCLLQISLKNTNFDNKWSVHIHFFLFLGDLLDLTLLLSAFFLW